MSIIFDIKYKIIDINVEYKTSDIIILICFHNKTYGSIENNFYVCFIEPASIVFKSIINIDETPSAKIFDIINTSGFYIVKNTYNQKYRQFIKLPFTYYNTIYAFFIYNKYYTFYNNIKTYNMIYSYKLFNCRDLYRIIAFI